MQASRRHEYYMVYPGFLYAEFVDQTRGSLFTNPLHLQAIIHSFKQKKIVE